MISGCYADYPASYYLSSQRASLTNWISPSYGSERSGMVWDMGGRYHPMVWYDIEIISFDFNGIIWETCWYHFMMWEISNICRDISFVYRGIRYILYIEFYSLFQPSLFFIIIIIIISLHYHVIKYSNYYFNYYFTLLSLLLLLHLLLRY